MKADRPENEDKKERELRCAIRRPQVGTGDHAARKRKNPSPNLVDGVDAPQVIHAKIKKQKGRAQTGVHRQKEIRSRRKSAKRKMWETEIRQEPGDPATSYRAQDLLHAKKT